MYVAKTLLKHIKIHLTLLNNKKLGEINFIKITLKTINRTKIEIRW